jgi:hypothetical protein
MAPSYLVAALSALDAGGIVQAVFLPECQLEEGVVRVLVMREGRPVDMLLDDYVPIQGKVMPFMQPTASKAVWPCLL